MLNLENCTMGHGKTLYQVKKIGLQRGKLAALIGANGAGKSTLLNAIALGVNGSGEISWEGKELYLLTPGQRSTIISLVESRFTGGQYLSTKEYLDLGRFPYTGISGKLSAADEEVVNIFSKRFALDRLLTQSTLTLSDGERQRASIARALIQQTPLLLLDEPTSFLDYPNKRSIMESLRQIAREDNKLVVMASHDLDLCLEYCDEVIVINPSTHFLEQYDVASITLDQLVKLAFG